LILVDEDGHTVVLLPRTEPIHIDEEGTAPDK
jgi:hypothetical protein